MLNYIWSGLIVSSLLFAIGYDARDLAKATYRNGESLPIRLTFPAGDDGSARRVPVRIELDPETYARFYETGERPSGTFDGAMIRSQDGLQLRFFEGIELPEPLATIRTASRSSDGELQGVLTGAVAEDGGRVLPVGGSLDGAVRFEPTRFVRMNAMSQAALDFAATAAEIALGLIGVLALFLGLLKIGEEAGIIHALVRWVRPVLRPLFPEVPPDHPALGMIALNLTANVFGLGNAATPFGIKAMEELQKLNPSTDTATNSMVMLLAINTASVQIMPPVLLLALLGLQINELVFAIIITTGLSLVVAVVATRLYGRLPASRASDPHGAAFAGSDAGGARRDESTGGAG